MVSSLLARCIIVTIGTLYPGYRSYKSLINADLRGVVVCLRYWIVFSIFIACETVTDVLLSWFPFYYWIKIFIVLWMNSPAGSTVLYKRFVQPVLKEREQEIDELIEQTKQKGYTTLYDLTTKGLRYASTVFLNTAVLGQVYLGDHLKRSLSASDIGNASTKVLYNPPATLQEAEEEEEQQEEEEVHSKLSKSLKESQNSTSNNKITQRSPARQREKSNDQSSESKLPTETVRRQQRQGNKTTAAVYSSSESTHIGTISKRQMMPRSPPTPKKSAVKLSKVANSDAVVSNFTDDENEIARNRF